MTSSEKKHYKFICLGTCKIEAIYVEYENGNVDVTTGDTDETSFGGLCKGVSLYNNPELCEMERTTNKDTVYVEVIANKKSKAVKLNAIFENYYMGIWMWWLDE